MTGWDNRDTCQICGSAISDTNPDGVGFGCRANVVKPALRDTFRHFKRLDIWVAKVAVVKERYLAEYKDVKFRSEFKKDFYESMKVAERVSAKQLQTMLNILEYSGIRFDLWKQVEEPMLKAYSPTSNEERDYHDTQIEIHKKLYLSGRKNRNVDVEEETITAKGN